MCEHTSHKVMHFEDFLMIVERQTRFWRGALGEYLRLEIEERKLSYADIAGKLNAVNYCPGSVGREKRRITAQTIADWVYRGSFSAAVLISLLNILDERKRFVERLDRLGSDQAKMAKNKGKRIGRVAVRKKFKKPKEVGRES